MRVMTNKGPILVVGASAYAKTGKDHTYESLGKQFPSQFTMTRVAFADPIKDTVNGMFGWDQRHANGELKEVDDPYWKFSPRLAYQKFGTEFGRQCNPDIWLLIANRKFEDAQEQGYKLVFVTDVRFPNEVKFLKDMGATIISLWSEETEPSMDENGNFVFPTGVRMHESEQYISEIRDTADLVIHNDRATEYERGLTALKNIIGENL